jgi:hypothetical protein
MGVEGPSGYQADEVAPVLAVDEQHALALAQRPAAALRRVV